MKSAALACLFRPGNWVRLPLALLHHLNSSEVIVLAEIINQSVLSDSDEFIYSVEDFENRTGFNYDAQKRSLKSLQEKRIVVLTRKGIPSKRSIRIDWEEVGLLVSRSSENSSIDPQLSRGSVSADSHSVVNEDPRSHTIQQEKTIKNRFSGFDFSEISEEHQKDGFDNLAEQMANSLAEKRKLFRKPNLRNWAKSLRDFAGASGFTVSEITETFLSYLEKIDQPYAPLAFSADAFIMKWNGVRAFVERNKSPSASKWDDVK